MNPLLLLGVVLLSASGCATIMNDDFMAIPISTDQPGAQVRVNGHTHNTPTVLAMPRGLGDQTLVFIKDGQEEPPVLLKEGVSPLIFLNALWGLTGILLVAIDASGPHGYTLHPNPVTYSFATQQLAGLDRGPAPDDGAWDGP